MNAKQGYKHTDVGEIPEEWKVVKVKDLGEVITGTTPRTAVKEYWGGPYPFVTPTDISEAKCVRRTGRTVSSKGVEKGRLIPKDSVLVTCIASIGKIAMASQPSITNQQINAIICKPSVDPHYVYYAIDSKTHILRTWAGQTQKPIVKKSLFEKFPIAFPPLVEQRGISRVLSCVDNAIHKANEVIEETNMLKRGLMQRLLSRGIEHKEFQETKIGKMPKEWKIVKIKEVAEVKGRVGWRGYKRTDFVEPENGAISLGANNITEGDRLNFVDLRYVSWKKYYESPEIHVKSGDIIMAQRGSLGKIAIIDQDIKKATINPNIVLLKNIKVNNFYLYYALSSHITKKQIIAVTLATTVPLLTQQQIKSFRIPLPSSGEQKKIAEILLIVDKKLEFDKERKEKLESIKKGLMQVLLTGRVRVKVD